MYLILGHVQVYDTLRFYLFHYIFFILTYFDFVLRSILLSNLQNCFYQTKYQKYCLLHFSTIEAANKCSIYLPTNIQNIHTLVLNPWTISKTLRCSAHLIYDTEALERYHKPSHVNRTCIVTYSKKYHSIS